MLEAFDIFVIFVGHFKKIMFLFRPHHFVCFLSFQGKGYSSDFVDRVNEILTTLKDNPQEKLISVVQGCDSACEKCPNQKFGKCQYDEAVSEKDSAYSTLLNITYGNKLSFSDMQKIRTRIRKDDFIKVCAKCMWFDICLHNLFQ